MGVVLALLLLVALPPIAPATALAPAAVAQAEQLRALWVDAFGDGLSSPAQIDDVVATAKAANLNAIVAQVVRRGDCWCNRAAVPRTDDPSVAPAPFDPLQTLLDKAHAQGIEVHAWVIATAIWRGDTPPSSPAHVFNLHGPSATGANSWLATRSDGLQQVGTDWMLDPGNADAAAWVVRVATSIVASYAVDGLNLDRIRYPDGNLGTNVPSWGYNPAAVSRFQQASGRSDVPGNGDPQWTQWRRDQVTAIVRKVYVESYALRPGVRISADTIAYGNGPQSTGGWETTRAYTEQLQDWIGWMREGILDLNLPMNYKRDAFSSGSNDQRRMYLEWSDFAKDWQFGRQTVVGSAPYLNEIDATVRQVRTALAPSAAGHSGVGWIGYSYRTPDPLANAGTRTGAASRAELVRALTRPSEYDAAAPPVFATPAAVPAMPWKVRPATGHIRGTARSDDGTPLTQAKVDLYDAVAGSYLRSQITDGVGWYAFVDVTPGRYRVLTGAPRVTGGLLGTVEVHAGALATPTASVVPMPSACGDRTAGAKSGPGIPPPPAVTAGIAGFHAAWYGQSGYPTLCPGERSTATVAYYNSGSRGWTAGTMGEVAYLGTWSPEPGQDRASALGGDGTLGSPNTGWPRYDRIASQPATWVGPGQVAWFQFTIQAPTVPGAYRLHLRPLIEGATWMEDYGVYWVVTVQ